MFDVLGNYHSDRIGMHTYVNSNKVTGYWETGQRGRLGMLMAAKVWTSLNFNESDGVTVVKGFVFFQPIVVIIGIGTYIFSLFTDSLPTIAMTSLIHGIAICVFGKQIRNESKDVVQWLENICEQAEIDDG